MTSQVKNRIHTILTGVLLVIMDFDRTLFDTSAYYADFLEWLDAAYGPVVTEATRQAEKVGEFDIFKFLEEAYHLAPATVQRDFTAFLRQKYHGYAHSYLLPGAPSLIKFVRRHTSAHPVIITTGSVVHQLFKLGLCPELDNLPFRIISGNKGALIQDDLDVYQGVEFNGVLYKKFALVDDKASNVSAVKPSHELADRSRLLFHVIRRDGKDSTPTGRIDITTVRGLSPVESALRRHLRELA